MPERRRYSIYAKMKEQGWVKSHPDIQIPVPRLSYGSLFIELKTPETYPFRKMRNGKYWIEGAKETNAWGHQYAQLTRLGELRRWGNFCCFAPDGETAKRIIEYYLALEDGDITAHGLQFEKYKFYFGRYVPEEMAIMKLV